MLNLQLQKKLRKTTTCLLVIFLVYIVCTVLITFLKIGSGEMINNSKNRRLCGISSPILLIGFLLEFYFIVFFYRVNIKFGDMFSIVQP